MKQAVKDGEIKIKKTINISLQSGVSLTIKENLTLPIPSSTLNGIECIDHGDFIILKRSTKSKEDGLSFVDSSNLKDDNLVDIHNGDKIPNDGEDLRRDKCIVLSRGRFGDLEGAGCNDVGGVVGNNVEGSTGGGGCDGGGGEVPGEGGGCYRGGGGD